MLLTAYQSGLWNTARSSRGVKVAVTPLRPLLKRERTDITRAVNRVEQFYQGLRS
ncbi:MAG: hypothetical protein IT178_15865 [Acidobacteria bacterium]|nr:hypothetical protein [Acidobacteriota bacterium]